MMVKNKKTGLKEDSRLFAFIATFFSIVGFIIALILKKEDKYVMYYARQSLAVFLVIIVAGVINAILAWIPGVGWFVAGIISAAVTILWIFSWAFALTSQEKHIPVINNISKHFNF